MTPDVEHIGGRSEERVPPVPCDVLFGPCTATCLHGAEAVFRYGGMSLKQLEAHVPRCDAVTFSVVRVTCDPHGLATTLERGHSLAELAKVADQCRKANGGTA